METVGGGVTAGAVPSTVVVIVTKSVTVRAPPTPPPVAPIWPRVISMHCPASCPPPACLAFMSTHCPDPEISDKLSVSRELSCS